MKICILGGCGFIGKNLINNLHSYNHKIVVYGRGKLSDNFREKVTQVTGEFTDFDLLRKYIDGSDVVFHLIGSTNPSIAEKNKLFDIRQNVEPTLRLLELGASDAYKRIVFLSSGGTVYGKQYNGPIQEDSPQWPISAYGVSKVSIERYLHLYNHIHGLDYQIARVSNPFGEHQSSEKGQGVVAALINCALSNKPFQMVGDGSIVRDYIYVADVVEALRRMASYTGTERVFNIGSGIGRSISDITKLVQKQFTNEIRIHQLPPRGIDVPVNVLEITRAVNELGWEPKIQIEDALHRTISWARSNSTFHH